MKKIETNLLSNGVFLHESQVGHHLSPSSLLTDADEDEQFNLGNFKGSAVDLGPFLALFQ